MGIELATSGQTRGANQLSYGHYWRETRNVRIYADLAQILLSCIFFAGQTMNNDTLYLHLLPNCDNQENKKNISVCMKIGLRAQKT